jgi:hypothetical protein
MLAKIVVRARIVLPADADNRVGVSAATDQGNKTCDRPQQDWFEALHFARAPTHFITSHLERFDLKLSEKYEFPVKNQRELEEARDLFA